jgi:hypothetical protein
MRPLALALVLSLTSLLVAALPDSALASPGQR